MIKFMLCIFHHHNTRPKIRVWSPCPCFLALWPLLPLILPPLLVVPPHPSPEALAAPSSLVPQPSGLDQGLRQLGPGPGSSASGASAVKGRDPTRGQHEQEGGWKAKSGWMGVRHTAGQLCVLMPLCLHAGAVCSL